MRPTSSLGFTILLAIARLITSVSASCFPSAKNETIGFFSKAPLAHGYTHLSPSECATECNDMSACQAWLFVVNAKECQFYRSPPVAQAKSAGFILGSCDTTSDELASKVPLLGSSSSVVPGSQTAQPSLSKVRTTQLWTRVSLEAFLPSNRSRSQEMQPM
ncbi:hypothetical protein F1880_004725 [Penicillium rolfsii]|nr:hypothetical protein F1880_004725 [Penicillium rolfsii]